MRVKEVAVNNVNDGLNLIMYTYKTTYDMSWDDIKYITKTVYPHLADANVWTAETACDDFHLVNIANAWDILNIPESGVLAIRGENDIYDGALFQFTIFNHTNVIQMYVPAEYIDTLKNSKDEFLDEDGKRHVFDRFMDSIEICAEKESFVRPATKSAMESLVQALLMKENFTETRMYRISSAGNYSVNLSDVCRTIVSNWQEVLRESKKAKDEKSRKEEIERLIRENRNNIYVITTGDGVLRDSFGAAHICFSYEEGKTFFDSLDKTDWSEQMLLFNALPVSNVNELYDLRGLYMYQTKEGRKISETINLVGHEPIPIKYLYKYDENNIDRIADVIRKNYENDSSFYYILLKNGAYVCENGYQVICFSQDEAKKKAAEYGAASVAVEEIICPIFNTAALFPLAEFSVDGAFASGYEIRKAIISVFEEKMMSDKEIKNMLSQKLMLLSHSQTTSISQYFRQAVLFTSKEAAEKFIQRNELVPDNSTACEINFKKMIYDGTVSMQTLFGNPHFVFFDAEKHCRIEDFLRILKEIFKTKEELAKIAAKIKENTKTEYIRIKTKIRSEQLPITCSKFGGIPYWPKEMLEQYPQTEDGRKFTMLSQINLSDLPKNDVFPETGILQFFILDEMDTTCKVIFHKEIEEPLCLTYFNNLIPTSLMLEEAAIAAGFWKEGFPIIGEFALEFFKAWDYANPTENCFEIEIRKATKQLGIPISDDFSTYDLPEEILNEFYEHTDGHKLLGRPYFVQYDYREDGDKDILLLQIDSAWSDSEEEDQEHFINLGDAGTAGFFINPDDLKKLDFSNVFYDWQCC